MTVHLGHSPEQDYNLLSVRHTGAVLEAPAPTAATIGHIPSLDGIRGLAFLLVFSSHIALPELGAFSVSIFFFLSGYLITTLLRVEHTRTGRISLRNFYVRRALRIFPPMYIAIAIIATAQVLWLTRGTLPWRHVLAASTFTLNYVEIKTGTWGCHGLAPLWSLAVEEHFYLLFPALFSLLCLKSVSYRKQAVLLGLLCIAVLLWRCGVYAYPPSPEAHIAHIKWSTDTRIDIILFGSIMALAFNPRLEDRVGIGWPLIAIGAGLLALSLVVRADIFRLTVRFTLQGIAFVPLFYGAIHFSRHWVFRALNSRVLVHLGTLSYSLYLGHLFFIVFFRSMLQSRSLVIVAAGASSYIFAAIISHSVEQPLALMRKRFV